MRFNKPIFFQRIVQGVYDERTGNYGEDITTEEKRYADITNSGVETLKLIYGELKQGSLTIRLQRPYTGAFDRIRIGDKVYSVDFSRGGKTFVVSEVQ